MKRSECMLCICFCFFLHFLVICLCTCHTWSWSFCLFPSRIHANLLFLSVECREAYERPTSVHYAAGIAALSLFVHHFKAWNTVSLRPMHAIPNPKVAKESTVTRHSIFPLCILSISSYICPLLKGCPAQPNIFNIFAVQRVYDWLLLLVLSWTKWRNSSTARAPWIVSMPSTTHALVPQWWVILSGGTYRWMPPRSFCSF